MKKYENIIDINNVNIWLQCTQEEQEQQEWEQ